MPLSICVNRKSQVIVKHPLGVNSPTDRSKKGNGSCGLSIHNTGAHLADYVQGWGPLWTWSTFGFEDINGTIMDFFYIFIYLLKDLYRAVPEQKQ